MRSESFHQLVIEPGNPQAENGVQAPQISTMTMVPSLMGWENEALMTVLIGLVLACALVGISVMAFDRKQF